MNFRVSGQGINTTTSVKYLGIYQLGNIPKLNSAIGLLSKVRHNMPKFPLKSIYYSLFNSHVTYASKIWGQIKTKLLQELVKS